MSVLYHLEVSGTPSEKGLAHGESFKAPIQALSEIRKELFARYVNDSEKLKSEEIIKCQLEVLKNFPDLYQEFVGISEASGVSLRDLYILNNYTDLRDFFGHPPASVDSGACSIFYSRLSNAVVSGQTWDMHASAKDYILKLDVLDSDSNKTQILTVVGGLALAGVNSSGLAVYINNLHSMQFNKKGLMWPAFVRLLLESCSAGGAKEVFNRTMPASGHNYLLCDSEEAFNVECTSDSYELTDRAADKSEDFLFHTNHYLGSLVKYENMSRRSKSTDKRFNALKKYKDLGVWKQKPSEDVIDDFFKGESLKDLSINEPANKTETMTCGGIYFDHNTKSGRTFSGLIGENKNLKLEL